METSVTEEPRKKLLNPFLFIRGFSCPRSVQTQNCLKLTITGFPYNLLLASCGDIGFLKKNIGQVLVWKSGLKVPYCL
jgi:hypothetical protein